MYRLSTFLVLVCTFIPLWLSKLKLSTRRAANSFKRYILLSDRSYEEELELRRHTPFSAVLNVESDIERAILSRNCLYWNLFVYLFSSSRNCHLERKNNLISTCIGIFSMLVTHFLYIQTNKRTSICGLLDLFITFNFYMEIRC